MSEIKVTPLLGVQEFNRSSTLVKIGGKHVLLDCGLNLSALNEENDDHLLPDFSFLFGTNSVNTSIDCVIISHFHLDHSGALPYLTENIGFKGPIYMTQPTKTIAPFVWRDCHKTLREKNFFPDFLASSRITDCMNKVTTVVYSQLIAVDNEMTVTVYPSNQPLGPDIFHLEVGQQSIFYTGGCNLKPYNKPSILPQPLPEKVNGSTSDDIASSSSSSNLPNQQSDLTIKMNGCMLSFKIGQSVFHRQVSPQKMQLITAVFNNLNFMDEANEDEFWQRIAYEMTLFSSPLNDDSKLKWKALFYNSLRSCGEKSPENLDDMELSQEYVDQAESGNDSICKNMGKKKRKAKKAKNKNIPQAPDDLMKFDTPEVDVLASDKKPISNSYNPDPAILDEQHLLINVFSERLKSTKISPEFWTYLIKDLKKKGKILKSTSYLEEYFRKLANIQMEIMRTSNNIEDAAEKWPLFIALNDLDLTYFFENKWDYRNQKTRFFSTSSPSKSSKAKKQKQKVKQESQQVTFSVNSDEGDQSEPALIDAYDVNLEESLICITLFANRLKKTKMGSEFWTFLSRDFDNIGKPVKTEAALKDYFKYLANRQLDIMKSSKNSMTAIKRWPLFMMLHDLPLDIFLDDKWTYRKLKPNFN